MEKVIININFLDVLLAVLIALKIAGVSQASWLVTLSPLIFLIFWLLFGDIIKWLFKWW